MLDIYVYGDALRISPEAPVQVLKVVKREYCGGGAASVAADVMALGARCCCIGIVGDDKNGLELRKRLTEQGADVSGLLTIQTAPPSPKNASSVWPSIAIASSFCGSMRKSPRRLRPHNMMPC